METLKLRLKAAPKRGFTLVETLVAMFIMAVGLVALGSLAAQTLSGTTRTHYSALAADLASEKLEDLGRWPTFDPNIYAAAGTSVGGLTSDQSANVTSGGIPTELVNYYDDVEISDANGAIAETVSQVSGGVTTYKTTSHNPDGTITTSSSASATTADISAFSFHRRWSIEMDQPVTGLRRITVLVTLNNGFVQPPVSVQMTMVRP